MKELDEEINIHQMSQLSEILPPTKKPKPATDASYHYDSSGKRIPSTTKHCRDHPVKHCNSITSSISHDENIQGM